MKQLGFSWWFLQCTLHIALSETSIWCWSMLYNIMLLKPQQQRQMFTERENKGKTTLWPFSNLIQRNFKLRDSKCHHHHTKSPMGPSSVWGQQRSFEEWFEDLEAGLCHKLASPLPRYYIFPSLSVSSSPLISFSSVAVLMGDKNSRPPWSIPCLDQSHIYFLYSCPGIPMGFPLFFFNGKF